MADTFKLGLVPLCYSRIELVLAPDCQGPHSSKTNVEFPYNLGEILRCSTNLQEFHRIPLAENRKQEFGHLCRKNKICVRNVIDMLGKSQRTGIA
ncbi:MAG TPA: hypothetical protein GX509_06050 [Firmicutes bacterium]|nr:hypothetical protein [Bacillota bacterium]